MSNCIFLEHILSKKLIKLQSHSIVIFNLDFISTQKKDHLIDRFDLNLT
jgi:hypothetical protein